MIRWEQVRDAWYDIEVEYGVRRNKNRSDNRPYEVFALVKTEPVEHIRVVAAYSDDHVADWRCKELTDKARAESVIRLLKGRA